MNPVKNFLQDIVSGKLNNAEEARIVHLGFYTDEQRIRKSDNITDRKKAMIEGYDQVRKIFLTPRSIADTGYVPTFDESDDKSEKVKNLLNVKDKDEKH